MFMNRKRLQGAPTQSFFRKAGSSDWWLAGVVFVAAFFRLYRISSLTEFLGDQGRTMMVLHDWLHLGAMPLSGPTTLTGHHLGPAFYYLIYPAYVLARTPVGVSVWMAILGVVATYVLYRSVHMVYGRIPALLVSMLYALSPSVIQQDRIIWEPNLVPLFGLIFAWLAIRQHDRISLPTVIVQGAVCAILVQLHYPNVFFLMLLGVVVIGHSIRIRHFRYIPMITLGWLAGFAVFMTPFLIYEFAHGFSDIRGIGEVFLQGGSSMGKREMLLYAIDYAHRVVGNMLPNMTPVAMAALFAGWCVFLVLHFTSWNIFWTVWFVFGVAAMARYNGVVFDHYLLYVLPAPFFMLASVLSESRKKVWKSVSVAVIVALCIIQVQKTDVFDAGNEDIARTSALVERMKDLAGNKPYSFTLVQSRSFSDLHYRYFMEELAFVPRPITAPDYDRLFVVCDSALCPGDKEIATLDALPAVCFDPHCSGTYPDILLKSEWAFAHSETVSVGTKLTGKVYIFQRI